MAIDWKQRAQEQWNEAPCGPDGRPTPILELLAAKRDYAPWLPAALDYHGSNGLDVLDVGCGQGADVVEYALAGANATGVDLTDGHVNLSRANVAEMGLDATIVKGDAEQLPFSGESFDRVSSNGVLHHTPGMQQALAEIRRVLRPNGLATVIVYNRDSAHYWIEQVLRAGILGGGIRREGGMDGVLSAGVEIGNGRPLVNVYGHRRLRRMMRAAGFRDVTVKASPLLERESVVFAKLGWAPPLPIGWYLIARGHR